MSQPKIELKLEDIFRVDFFEQHATCCRCDERAVLTRVAQDVDGCVSAAAFCAGHGREAAVTVRTTLEQTAPGSYINRKLMNRFAGMTEQIQAALYGEEDEAADGK